MARRRKQGADMSETKPLYDPQAIQAVIGRVQDEPLRDFLVATVDVVTGISMAQQMRNQDERAEVYKAIQDIRFQIKTANTAREANHKQLVEFFTRLFTEFDTLKADVADVRLRVDAHEERLDAKRHRMDAQDARLAAIETRLAAAEHALSARPTPEEAKATYDGVRRILAHLGLDGDGR